MSSSVEARVASRLGEASVHARNTSQDPPTTDPAGDGEEVAEGKGLTSQPLKSMQILFMPGHRVDEGKD